MKTQYNFQLRKQSERMDWENIEPISRHYSDRVTALLFAQRLARMFKAEIRLTEGEDPFRTSGTYVREENN